MTNVLTTEEIEWLAALRSGEFPQGIDHLNKNGFYCCLGVRCELDYRRDPTLVDRSDESAFGVIQYDGDNQMPTDNIYLRWKLPMNIADELAELNDSGYDFYEIADAFESWVARGRPPQLREDDEQ